MWWLSRSTFSYPVRRSFLYSAGGHLCLAVLILALSVIPSFGKRRVRRVIRMPRSLTVRMLELGPTPAKTKTIWPQ